MTQIKQRTSDAVLYELENTNLKDTLEKAVKEKVNLSGADLSGTNLSKTNLERTNLSGANLSGSDLSEANLSGTNLSGANLSETNLSRANLKGADLSRTNLSRADFYETNLSKAYLYRANFEGVAFGGTQLSNIDFRSILNLELTKHSYPSDISTKSFIKSNGEIPEHFLKGVGLSSWEIESIKLYNSKLSTTEITDIVYRIDELRNEHPIQIHNLFISYSRSDSNFVDSIETHLNKKNIRFWRDIHDATAGPLGKMLIREIRNRIVLLILSKESVSSDWVEFEIQQARNLEKQLDRNIICPITLDDSWKDNNWSPALSNQLKKYNILDFSNWSHQSFMEIQFQKLVKGLDLYYKEEK